jgi:hypothetical protein
VSAWLFPTDPTPKTPVRITARQNVFNVTSVFTLFRPPGTPPNPLEPPSPQRLLGRLQSWVAWTEAENVYRRGCGYASHAPNRYGQPTPVVKSRTELQGIWKSPPAGSIEARIRFRDRPAGGSPGPLILERRGEGSESIPAGVGANPDSTDPNQP